MKNKSNKTKKSVKAPKKGIASNETKGKGSIAPGYVSTSSLTLTNRSISDDVYAGCAAVLGEVGENFQTILQNLDGFAKAPKKKLRTIIASFKAVKDLKDGSLDEDYSKSPVINASAHFAELMIIAMKGRIHKGKKYTVCSAVKTLGWGEASKLVSAAMDTKDNHDLWVRAADKLLVAVVAIGAAINSKG